MSPTLDQHILDQHILDQHILDGRAVAEQMGQEVAAGVRRLVESGRRPPKLVAVLVGDDPASQTYVAAKARACEKQGIRSETLRLPAGILAADLVATLHQLGRDDEVDGILVQLPLPDHFPERAVLGEVPPEKDVDGFHRENVGRLWIGEPGFTPATPTGIVELLRRYEIPIAGREAVVVGRSTIVGKPMAALLLAENATVTVCHSRTRDLAAVCRRAEILVAAIGRAGTIGPEHVREGAVVIDVGINRIDSGDEVERLYPGDEARRESFAKRGYVLAGDVDFARVRERAAAITPVPGGVGPLTVAQLLVNTLRAARWRQGLDAAGDA